jgi:DNA-binding MarR family transcriptional regulator
MSFDEEKYEQLKLGNQLCFPLYACAKEIIRKYKPYLDNIDLTYTQYITMMVLWEMKTVNVKTLGECLYLDSGTLTPVLKKLESKGYITRVRSSEDERNLVVTITPEGENLKDLAINIPSEMGACVKLEPEEAKLLYNLLYKIIGNIR